MPSEADDLSSDLPTTTIARRGPSENGAPAVTIILEGPASDWVKIECLNRLSSRFGSLPEEKKSYGRYVGVHAITLMPVFTTGSSFLQRPSAKACAAKDIIFDEQLLRNDERTSAGLLKHTSLVIRDGVSPAQKRRERFPARPEPAKRSRLDDNGTAIPRPHHMELPLRLGHVEEYHQSEFFHLAIPCLGRTQVPEALVDLARAIQVKLPRDNLHLHVVVMAVIIWVDIHFDPAQKGRKRFPPQNLVNFVAYWPHFLRFHEVFHLPIYCHPCQFTQVMGQNSAHRECRKKDWENEAKTLVDLCRLHHRTDYVHMLPSSWPGSTLTFPADGEKYGFAAPTVALARILGQPSIHTIGHPAYPCDGSAFTALLLPRNWVSPAIKFPMPHTAKKVSDEVIEPERREKGCLRLITGQVLNIFPGPEDLDPLSTIPTRPLPTLPPRPATEQDNVQIDDRVRGFWEQVASPEFFQAQKEAQTSKLQAAIAAGISIDQITFDQYNLLSWAALDQVASTTDRAGSADTKRQLLSPELSTEVRVVVSAHLVSPHRHHEFRNFNDLVQAAEDLEVTSVRTALKRAVDQTQMLKETMEEFLRFFHSRAFIHDDPTDWTFCRAIAPNFLIPLLHLIGADQLATQPVQSLTPEQVCDAMKSIQDVHKIMSSLLAPSTVVCEPGSRVLIEECMPLTTYWMKSLMKSSPFETLEVFEDLLELISEDN